MDQDVRNMTTFNLIVELQLMREAKEFYKTCGDLAAVVESGKKAAILQRELIYRDNIRKEENND